MNGQTVTVLGTKADPERDHIRVDGKLLRGAERLRYFVLNKPRGYVTTVTDPEGRPTVMQFFAKSGERLYPVGRLDFQSEGLLLVTNDGEMANKLTRAASGVEKTYLVKIAGRPDEEQIERLRSGVSIDKGRPREGKVHTAPAHIRQIRKGENPWFEVVLIEGRNRELRKMFEEIGHHVEKIRRVGYGPLVLDVEPGKIRELKGAEVDSLRLTAEGKLKPRRPKATYMLPKDAGKTPEERNAKLRRFDKRPSRAVGAAQDLEPRELQAPKKAESKFGDRPKFRVRAGGRSGGRFDKGARPVGTVRSGLPVSGRVKQGRSGRRASVQAVASHSGLPVSAQRIRGRFALRASRLGGMRNAADPGVKVSGQDRGVPAEMHRALSNVPGRSEARVLVSEPSQGRDRFVRARIAGAVIGHAAARRGKAGRASFGHVGLSRDRIGQARPGRGRIAHGRVGDLRFARSRGRAPNGLIGPVGIAGSFAADREVQARVRLRPGEMGRLDLSAARRSVAQAGRLVVRRSAGREHRRLVAGRNVAQVEHPSAVLRSVVRADRRSVVRRNVVPVEHPSAAAASARRVARARVWVRALAVRQSAVLDQSPAVNRHRRGPAVAPNVRPHGPAANDPLAAQSVGLQDPAASAISASGRSRPRETRHAWQFRLAQGRTVDSMTLSGC